MRRRGDVGARQLVDQLHEDGRDGRAEWKYKVMMLVVTLVMMVAMMVTLVLVVRMVLMAKYC